MVTSWQETSQRSMHHSFQFYRRRLRLWTHSHAPCWKLRIMPSRTVGSAYRVWSDTKHHLFLLRIQRVFQWTQSLDPKHALALPPHLHHADRIQNPMEGDDIDNPAVAQPLCTALQVALVDLLASWATFPVAVVGQSSGEIAAAYCVGSLSQDSAMRVSFFDWCHLGHAWLW